MEEYGLRAAQEECWWGECCFGITVGENAIGGSASNECC